LPLGPDPGEKHEQMQPEEDLGINGGTATNCVTVSNKLTDKGAVEHTVQVPVAVVLGHKGLDGNEHGTIEVPHLRWPEH
jgi:hypothetical protein